MSRRLRVGTRGSPLALAQAEEVASRLARMHPDIALGTVVIRTHGDEGYRQDLGSSLDGKRAFTKRVEDALLADEIDIAVHSLKDVPTDAVEGVELAAIPPRADPRDVFVAHAEGLTRDPPRGTKVGTSSLRRRAQLLARWPNLDVIELHGNVGTRLRHLDARDFEAVVLAAAGLDRLQIRGRFIEPLDPDVVTPAPGQGALAVECRSEDAETRALLAKLDDSPSRQAVEAERAVSARIGGSCNVPFGALATLDDGMMNLRAVVASVDGSRVIRAAAQGPAERSTALVESVSRALLDQGGRSVLEEVPR